MAGRSTLARTWWRQVEADLAAAESSASAGHHEWACFQAQQAGEKALRAFLYDHGRTSILGHSLRRLVRECQTIDAAFGALDDDARLLDQHYIPTRYPSGLDEETAPVDYYDQKDATRCRSSARSILGHVKPHFAS
jgi:HEPN domain-containing protein